MKEKIEKEGVPFVSVSKLDEVLSLVDGVIISTITSTHKELIIKAASLKKQIFCEKPLAYSLADVKECLVRTQLLLFFWSFIHLYIYIPFIFIGSS